MRRLWGFAVFAGIAAGHLLVLLLGLSSWAAPTKALLMPTLFVALLIAAPRLRSEVTLWAGLGVLLSWAGDVLLASPGEAGFLVGVACFLFAHVSYAVLYVRVMKVRRLPWWTGVYAIWWIALVALLVPHVGALAVPLVVYGAVLCAAAAVASATSRTIAVGALLFLISDTLLALRMFLPGFGFPQQDATIMAFYCAGQGLIVVGAVIGARRLQNPPAPSTTGPARPADSPHSE